MNTLEKIIKLNAKADQYLEDRDDDGLYILGMGLFAFVMAAIIAGLLFAGLV